MGCYDIAIGRGPSRGSFALQLFYLQYSDGSSNSYRETSTIINSISNRVLKASMTRSLKKKKKGLPDHVVTSHVREYRVQSSVL